MSKIYKNEKRKTGSQSERPEYKFIDNKNIQVKGYQKYKINKNKVVPEKNNEKINFIKKVIEAEENKDTMIDLGCSNGLISFIGYFSGFNQIYSLDHDNECIELIRVVKKALNINSVKEMKYSFGDNIQACDLVIMGALIHWIFSCTALYGSFDSIISYLYSITNKTLLIEWIEPNDSAIKMFKHISFNREIIKEEYSKENFLKSMRKYFNNIEEVYKVNSTRILFKATI